MNGFQSLINNTFRLTTSSASTTESDKISGNGIFFIDLKFIASIEEDRKFYASCSPVQNTKELEMIRGHSKQEIIIHGRGQIFLYESTISSRFWSISPKILKKYLAQITNGIDQRKNESNYFGCSRNMLSKL